MQAEGEEPDPRFTLANERTFLAWVRTALALVAAGIGLETFVPPLAVPGLRQALAVGLALLGAAVSADRVPAVGGGAAGDAARGAAAGAAAGAGPGVRGGRALSRWSAGGA